MIKIYCNENDEPHFSRCIHYNTNNIACDECEQCPYCDCNIQFIHHDSNSIIIETDEDDLDVKTCLYNTFYNWRGCGVVDLDKEEDCMDCRFWYENIEVIKVKKGEL